MIPFIPQPDASTQLELGGIFDQVYNQIAEIPNELYRGVVLGTALYDPLAGRPVDGSARSNPNANQGSPLAGIGNSLIWLGVGGIAVYLIAKKL